MKKAFLILEDGTVFEGKSIGVDKEIISEIVFNTSMTGYLEVLTDRKSTRLNSSHANESRMPSSA